MVVGENARQPERDSQQPRALRRDIEPVSVRAPHDPRELVECRLPQLVLLEKSIEAAEWTIVGQLDALDVVGNGAGLPGDAWYLGRWNEEELRLAVDEASDQPGAGD